MVIPKPLCQCGICEEARKKGIPYARTGPSAFLHDIKPLIDTPAEIASQLNRCHIRRIDYLMLTHLDPDHVEGLRVVEQITLDSRTWRAYPEKQICLLLPEQLGERIREIRSQYGPLLDSYRQRGLVRLMLFQGEVQINNVQITAIAVDRGSQLAFVYVFEKPGRRVVHAPAISSPSPSIELRFNSPTSLSSSRGYSRVV
jgi:phosphoribosyl 1,2-cyclic phosphate phosphodiesterase